MRNYLKRYNEETKEWELITTPSVSDGKCNEDTEIIVTNPNYAGESGETSTLSDTLDVISDDISRLQRNVSWLARYGGGGSGTGGGGIETVSQVVYVKGLEKVGDVYYSDFGNDKKEVTIVFRISNSRTSDKFIYTASWNDVQLARYRNVSINGSTDISVTIRDINTTKMQHTFSINAVDNDNMALDPFRITINMRSLLVECDQPDESILAGNSDAKILVQVKNSMGKMAPAYLVCNNTLLTNHKYIHEDTSYSTDKHIVEIPWKALAPEGGGTIGTTYPIRITVQNTVVGEANTIMVRRTVVNGDELVISLVGISDYGEYVENIITDEEIVKTAIDDTFSFSFKPYVNTTSAIYYSVTLSKYMGKGDDGKPIKEDEQLLIGNYFDEVINDGSASSYIDNVSRAVPNTENGIKWINNATEEGEYIFTIRCWYKDRSGEYKCVDKYAICNVVSSNGLYLPFGNYKSQCIARWNSENGAPIKLDNTTFMWTSDRYFYEDYDKLHLDTYKVNNISNGYISKTGTLKIQNQCYGKIDLSNIDKSRWLDPKQGSGGFTLSITFKSEDMPERDSVILYWGYDTSNYFIITLDNAVAVVNNNVVSAMLGEESVKTVDFVLKMEVNPNNTDDITPVVKIYVNGILFGAIDKVPDGLGDEIYVGCDNNINNHSIVEIIDITLFRTALPDTYLIANGYNSRFNSMRDVLTDDDYKSWKRRNYFITNENDKFYNLLYLDGKYQTVKKDTIIAESSLPIIFLTGKDGDNDVNFDDAWFFESQDKTSPSTQRKNALPVLMDYYDPTTNKTLSNLDISVWIQGSSSLGYRSKNLEIAFNGTCIDGEGNEQPILFQPKEDWMPENEFTLKADVMDSAHANNATIGEWINKHSEKLFIDTPAQTAIKNNKIYDLKKDWRDYASGNVSDCFMEGQIYDEVLGEEKKGLLEHDVLPKIAVEGFPVLLLVKWSNSSSDEYINAGIYSFNIGRYSPYNLGMKMLKAFSRRNNDNWNEEVKAPALVTNYMNYKLEESIRLNKSDKDAIIVPKNFFAYEFDASSDLNNEEYPLWSQSEMQWLKQMVGSFRYNGTKGEITDIEKVEDGDPIWNKLQSLFDTVANIEPTYHRYDLNRTTEGNYVPEKTNNVYSHNNNNVYELENKIHIRNFTTYFAIVTLFGLIDSLGKNFVLRTWDGGETWYPTFYDMDTALGLDNAGKETIESNAYVDVYENSSVYTYRDKEGNPQSAVTYYSIPSEITSDANLRPLIRKEELDESNYNSVIVNRNYYDSRYSLYNGKLWNILRTTDKNNNNTIVNQLTSGTSWYSYETAWENIRAKCIGDATDFTDLIKSHMDNCGEIIYNSDFQFKYVTKYKRVGADNETFGDIGFLHGNRIDYINKWLRKRINFFDGVFNFFDVFDKGLAINYCPMSYDTVIQFRGNNGRLGKMQVAANGPILLRAALDDNTRIYFIPEKELTDIMIFDVTSQSKQFSLYGTPLLTSLGNLSGIGFKGFTSASLQRLSEFNSKNCYNIIKDGVIFTNGGHFGKPSESFIKTINMSNTKFDVAGSSLAVDVDAYKYLDKVDISNSCVTSLVLPNTPLNELKVNGSLISKLELKDQPILQNLSFTACNRMTTINLDNCNEIVSSEEGKDEVVIDNLGELVTVSITDCAKIKNLKISNNPKLKTINLENLGTLERLTVTNCDNKELSITIKECPSLKEIYFEGLKTSKKASFVNKDNNFANIKTLSINDWRSFDGIVFGIEDSVYRPNLIKEDNNKYLGSYWSLDKGTNKYTFIQTPDQQADPKNVLDLTYLTNLEKLVLQNIDKLTHIRVGNSKEKPLVLSEEGMFNGTKNIERIFGNIRVSKTTIFSGMSAFYVNEPFVDDREDDGTPICNYVEDLSEKIDDASIPYYTNLTFDTGVVSIYKMFENHRNITISDAYYILSICDNVAILDSAFKNCSNIKINGIKRSDKYGEAIIDGFVNGQSLDENIFNHCTNAINVDNLFDGCDINGKLSSEILAPLTGITSFKNVFGSNDHIGMYNPKDGSLISKLNKDGNPNTAYQKEFDTNWFYIDTDKCFFPKNNNIKEVEGFNPCSLIGKYYDTHLLSNLKKLESLSNSFNSCSIDFNLEGDINSDKELFQECDNLKKISTSFRNVRGYNSRVSNGTLIENLFGIQTNIESIIESFNFSFAGNTVSIRWDENVFKDYVNLKEVRPMGLSSDTEINSLPFGGNIEKNCSKFPVGILSNMPNLTHFVGLFSNLKLGNPNLYGQNNPIGLPGEIFKNNDKLKDISYAFYGIGGADLWYHLTPNGFENCKLEDVSNLFRRSGHLIGGVPYHFLYQKNGNTIKHMDNMFAELNIEKDGNATLDAGLQTTYYEASDDEIREYAWDDEKGWNEYIYDGSRDFVERLKKCFDDFDDKVAKYPLPDLYSLNSGYSENISNMYLPDAGQNYGGDYTKPNFICPPDLFLYCSNTSDVTVNGVFFKAGQLNMDYGFTGMRGTIPPNIFKPLTRIKNIESMFRGMTTLLPYQWGDAYKSGIMYPPTLFENNTELATIKYFFQETIICGNTKIPNQLFAKLTNLSSLCRMWGDTVWVYSDYYQREEVFEEEMFVNNMNLNDISYMFYNSKGLYIKSNIFEKNMYLTNVMYFLAGGTNVKGSLPEFWNKSSYPYITLTNRCYYNIGGDIDQLNIYKEDPDISHYFN